MYSGGVKTVPIAREAIISMTSLVTQIVSRHSLSPIINQTIHEVTIGYGLLKPHAC